MVIQKQRPWTTVARFASDQQTVGVIAVGSLIAEQSIGQKREIVGPQQGPTARVMMARAT
ncbi:TPA: hypothetical protein DCE37_24595 [Candidatus Latescibacteria bacterium]|nr:hypothetical protein [Candidatus Latescibacterota bacterium]